jgi:hypothetical protein
MIVEPALQFIDGTANASNTLPGDSATTPYPDPTSTIPPATVGPGAIIEPPCAGTALTVSNA